jgi:hypothetical protein
MSEELWALLNGLNLNMVGVFFDDNFAYHEVIAVNILCTDKWSAQRVWRKYLTFVWGCSVWFVCLFVFLSFGLCVLLFLVWL